MSTQVRTALCSTILCGIAALAACTPAGNTDTPPQASDSAHPTPLDAPSAEAGPAAVQTGPSAPASDTRTRLWQCDSTRVKVVQDRRHAVLSFNGRKLDLPAKAAAADATTTTTYADTAGNQLQDAGDSATLTLAGVGALSCETTDIVSPWVEAEEAGATFRATGNEPGWVITIDGKHPLRLHAQMDYGQRRFDIDVIPAANGWTGQTADGDAARVQAVRATCDDDMSGARFEATVVVELGKQQYRGCGAWLDD